LGGSSGANLSSKKIDEDDSKKAGEPKKRLSRAKETRISQQDKEQERTIRVLSNYISFTFL
jgi:hypothetical protein